MQIFVKCILLILILTQTAFAQEDKESKLEPEKKSESMASQTQASTESDRGHYVILGYDLSTRGEFTNGYTSIDLSDDFDTTIEFKSGFSVGYEYRKAPMNDWGSAFGIIHTFQRDVESMTIDGDKTKAKGDIANVSMTSVYANLIYRWETFYIPFGLVFSSITYNPPDASSL